MMVIIPKGHYSENGPTMTVRVEDKTSIRFVYGWYQTKYQGRGLKGSDDG